MVLRRFLIILIAILLPATAFASKKYIVKRGDNLYDLSKKFGLTVGQIKSANELSGNRLDIGDELIIPDPGNLNGVTNRSIGNNNEHIVSKGDTLSEIAEKYGLTTKSLQRANNLNNSKLQIGQKLKIPAIRDEASVQAPIDVVSTKSPETASNDVKSEAADVTSSVTQSQYTVQKGDTLGHIAVKFYTTSSDIKTANGLKSDRLQIGQTLKIPSHGQREKTAEQETKTQNNTHPPVSAPNGIYTVEKGDTPITIANKLGVKTKELIELNNIKSTNLQIGQKLSVPGYQKSEERAEVIQAASPQPANEKEVDTQPTQPTTTPELIQNKPAEYIVQKGDTPSEIAEKLGVSTKELLQLNDINSKNLRIGQKLAVPGAGAEAQAETASPDNASRNETERVNSEETHPEQDNAGTTPDEYTVKKGDNLYDIAKKFGTTANTIKKNNNLKSTNLKIGQKLVLHSTGTVDTASTDSGKEDALVSAAKYTGKYTVRKGDTLGHLAIKFGVSQTELKSMNGLKNSNLRIGQVLRIPGSYKDQDNSTSIQSANAQLSEIYIKKRYVVKRGDTLSGVASRFGVTVVEIKKASALKNDVINTGDILLIPVPQETVTTSKYTVTRGDTLGKIAARYRVSLAELKNANGMTSDKIWVGMKLNIPGVYSSDSPSVDNNTAVTTQAVRSEYVVKKGDSLGLIAKRYGVSVRDLKKENNIKGSVIRIGQVLYIPGYVKPETKYIAVSEKPLQHANGHAKYTEPQVKNGRFSKESIIQVAKKYLGAPYKFGGYDLTTGIDCSGYVKKIFSRFNVELPRTARDIYYKAGYKVDKSRLDTGDLVFFQTYAKYPSHVGIYMGNDEFIHASSASRKVTIDNINKRYYRNRYIGAKRIQLSGLFYDEYSKDYRGFEN